jgi:hypothetical protein
MHNVAQSAMRNVNTNENGVCKHWGKSALNEYPAIEHNPTYFLVLWCAKALNLKIGFFNINTQYGNHHPQCTQQHDKLHMTVEGDT